MTVAQSVLTEILLYSVVLGAFFGVVYDLFRIRRANFSFSGKKKAGAVFEVIWICFEDIIFFLICSSVTCVFIYYFNSGRLRYLALLGAAFGFFVYYKTVGRLVMYFSVLILNFTEKVLKVLFGCTIVPMFRFLRFLTENTLGRLLFIITTDIYMFFILKSAEKLFGISKTKGKIGNEKTFKYFREGSGGGVHSVLCRNHYTDAV